VGLAELEEALARLYTDDGLRARFFADPRSVGAELRLEESEAERLAATDRERIELFAETLRLKRFGEVRGLLPRSLAALGEDELRARFLNFAREFVPEGVYKHHADALAFAGSLVDRLEGAPRRAAAFDGAVLGLFYRPRGRGAVARRGPAVALVRVEHGVALLTRMRGSSRYRVWGTS
jgi:hypothetical protein